VNTTLDLPRSVPTRSKLIIPRSTHADDDSATPLLFNLETEEGRDAFAALLRTTPPRFVHDTLGDQLVELIETREPTRKVHAADRDARIAAFLDGRAIATYGTWVYFPWSARLIHVLPRDEYRAVRSARNRYKITQPEQESLLARRIGVLGCRSEIRRQ
jgi:hypothetical protein